MRKLIISALFLGASTVWAAPVQPELMVGDIVHGEALFRAVSDEVPIDGAWLNGVTHEEALARLATGKDGFPRVATDNILDRWDVLAFIKARNTDLGALLMGGDTVLVSATTLDDAAAKRLKDQAKIPPSSMVDKRPVFSVYVLDEAVRRAGGHVPFTLVREQDAKMRDRLKKDAKVGYVVFAKIPGFRGGGHEVAFAVDKSIRIRQVVVRAPDGTTPTDLNQIAARFVGKGMRGQYAPLQAGGGGTVVAELERPMSDAFLAAMESVYMFEVAERDYFAFDN